MRFIEEITVYIIRPTARQLKTLSRCQWMLFWEANPHTTVKRPKRNQCPINWSEKILQLSHIAHTSITLTHLTEGDPYATFLMWPINSSSHSIRFETPENKQTFYFLKQDNDSSSSKCGYKKWKVWGLTDLRLLNGSVPFYLSTFSTIIYISIISLPVLGLEANRDWWRPCRRSQLICFLCPTRRMVLMTSLSPRRGTLPLEVR